PEVSMISDMRLGPLLALLLLAPMGRRLTPWSQISSPTTQSASESPTPLIPPKTCPITKPPADRFVPPAPYPTEIPSDSFWIGSEKLWTSRNKNGTWQGYWVTGQSDISHKVEPDKSF